MFPLLPTGSLSGVVVGTARSRDPMRRVCVPTRASVLHDFPLMRESVSKQARSISMAEAAAPSAQHLQACAYTRVMRLLRELLRKPAAPLCRTMPVHAMVLAILERCCWPAPAGVQEWMSYAMVVHA